MQNTQSAPPIRVRLYSHVTRTRFLHVEDALSIGKVRLFAGTYSRGQGLTTHTSHYLDLADARIVFLGLMNGEKEFSYQEYKGTPPQSAGQPARSRVLSVDVKGDKVYVELKSGPGRLTSTGAIMPQGRAETEVNVGFKLHEARRLAAEVLAYLQAWDVYRMMVFQEMAGEPPAYRLSPSSSRAEKSDSAPRAAREANARQPPVGGNGTRTGAAGTGDKAPVRSAAVAEAIFGAEEALRYGNGQTVDMANAKEAEAFRHYAAQKGRPPAAKTALQAYYQQHMIS